jgi:amino acid adenylation domain-containing protein
MNIATQDGFHLSPQQRWIWSWQKGLNCAPFQIGAAYLLQGMIVSETLQAAIDVVWQRHEILRTTFYRMPGMDIPVQVVREGNPPIIHTHNWCQLTTTEQETAVHSLWQRVNQVSLSVETVEWLSWHLIVLSPTERLLFVCLPALCADSLTVSNLMQEIAQACTGQLQSPDIHESPIQYADVAEVFNELLESEETLAGRQYWQALHLTTVPPASLYQDANNQTLAQGFTPKQCDLVIRLSETATLTSLVNQYGGSIAGLLLACWHSLLSRLSGQADLTVGVQVDGRAYEGLDTAIGSFARQLPIQIPYLANQRFIDIWQKIEQQLVDAYEWQDFFDLAAHFPDGFSFGFEFVPIPSPFTSDKISISLYKQYACISPFAIKLVAQQQENLITIDFHFDASIYTNETIKRLALQFQTLLDGIIQEPQMAVGLFNILPEAQYQQLLHTFNQNTIDNLPHQTIQSLFLAQAERTPQQTAVCDAHQQLTYDQLNRRANQLAHHLQAYGIGPDHIVGIYMERNVESLVTLLAILKAGGAYLPLDPIFPPARLSYILQEAQVKLIITQSTLRDNLLQFNCDIITIDNDWPTIAQADATTPVSYSGPQTLAYVIYTSGSTGRPKGVMVPHHAVVNLAVALHQAIYHNYPDPLNIGLNAPLMFDGSVKQWLQLIYGHAVHIVPEEIRPSATKLLEFIRQHQLDVLDCTPTQLRRLLAAGLGESSDWSPRLVLVGGEAIDTTTWASMVSRSAIQFVNVYGPTECTVDATVGLVNQQHPTLGFPIANVQIYLLDGNLQPVPIGVPGELHISGPGVARGYIGQPSKTAMCFIPNHFSDKPGQRLYKTGDLARFLPDGTIEFLGRYDHQVKVNGFRIELEEIERWLHQETTVHHAIVTQHQNSEENTTQLVAYIVPTEPSDPDLTYILRHSLRQNLPEYMIPTHFIILSHLPTTSSGKIDRQALPDITQYNVVAKAPYIAPRNQTEQIVVAIWQSVLHVDNIGIHDNFFDLGGHSLLLIEMFDKLQQTFDNKKITIVDLFRYPTVSTFTEYIRQEYQSSMNNEQIDKQANRQKSARSRQKSQVQKGFAKMPDIRKKS